MLIELAKADRPVEMADVIVATLSEAAGDPEQPGMDVCPDCGQRHEMSLPGSIGPDIVVGLRDEERVEHACTTLDILKGFGAVSTGPGRLPEGTVALTALGRLLAGSVLESSRRSLACSTRWAARRLLSSSPICTAADIRTPPR